MSIKRNLAVASVVAMSAALPVGATTLSVVPKKSLPTEFFTTPAGFTIIEEVKGFKEEVA